MHKHKYLTSAALVAALFAAACDDDDDDVVEPTPTALTANLTTAAEVPVCDDAGANALGSSSVTINPQNTTVTVTGTFSGLSGEATTAHIHIGDTDEAGPPVLTITDLTSPISQTFTSADYPSSPGAGVPATWAAFLNEMKEGNTYINIHTEACEAGEIRGQLVD